jgi:hypothetical protein
LFATFFTKRLKYTYVFIIQLIVTLIADRSGRLGIDIAFTFNMTPPLDRAINHDAWFGAGRVANLRV